MKKKLLALIPYLVIILACYLICPLFAHDASSTVTVLSIVIPLIVGVSSIVFGYSQGFSVPLLIASAVLFLPTLFFMIHPSGWIYLPIYVAVSAVGMIIGMLLEKKL
ncbi:MAG: hypothetical protein IKD37_03915 [Clostridia bacterium]|nr:hypothetical protein [Clostridia bacterium]